MIALSILIPTIVERKQQFEKLLSKLHKMARNERDTTGLIVQIGWECDNKEIAIGEKRNMLYAKADGLFSVQIDDDDDVPDMFLSYIATALTTDTDCLTYRERCWINGELFRSNHSIKYSDWGEKQDGFDYVRTPFMKSVIKTNICRHVPVPTIRFGEDHAWARLLKPHLKTEIHLEQELYYYNHTSKPEDHNERYGIKE